MKHKSSERQSVPQSAERIQQHIQGSLVTLRHFAKIYDDGYQAICFSMATEILKVLTDNALAAKARKTIKFCSPPKQNLSLMPLSLLIAAQVGGDEINFVAFREANENFQGYRDLSFVDWWSREKIYVASAAKQGAPRGTIPLNAEDQLKEHERESFTRREFVSILRNKMGAHIDNDLPALLDDLLRSDSFEITFSSGVVPFQAELPMKVSPIAAMMREIVFELDHSFAAATDQATASTRDT